MNTYIAVHNADTLKMYNGFPVHSASNWSLPTIPMGQTFTGAEVIVQNRMGKRFKLIQISGFVKSQEPRYVWTGDVKIQTSYQSSRFSGADGTSAQYTFKQDFDANGTNVVPPMSKMANFKLKHHFKKGDSFEGKTVGGEVNPKNPSAEASPIRLIIFTDSAQKPDGSVWAGKAEFQVPFNVVEGSDGSGNQQRTSEQRTLEQKTFFTLKNVFIGTAIIGGIIGVFVLLKQQKVI